MYAREWFQILTSKSVLLTYAFIGYVAISDRLPPSDPVDQTPTYSVSDDMYPSAQTCTTTMDEHVRVLKYTPRAQPFVVLTVSDPNWHAFFVSILHAARPPDAISPFSPLCLARAPPL